MKKVLVPLAEGFEEIEAVTIIDILRRAGAEVVVASLNKEVVKGSHGISICSDNLLDRIDVEDFHMIVLPGGMPGMENLRRSGEVIRVIQELSGAEKFTAAVCASPVVLEEAGITEGKTVTSHPAHAKFMLKADYTGNRVEVDGKMVTGQAAGSAMEFAFKLVEVLFGKMKAEEVNRSVLAAI